MKAYRGFYVSELKGAKIMSLKEVFEDNLSKATLKRLWTSVYYPALPITPQDFSIGALLPAVFYMFRWGQRRGKGRFIETFGKKRLDDKSHLPPSIDDIVEKLSTRQEWFQGFESETGKAILGDMLLTFCLENKKHATGRTEQVQRVYPTHYMASWIDLPYKVGNLRFVPEMITAILVNQKDGNVIDVKNQGKSYFRAAAGFSENAMLSLFGRQMDISGNITDLASDSFKEGESIGIDELLTIRIAQACKSAPWGARGGDGAKTIPNQRPIAIKATEHFREDISVFIRAYGNTIPRQAFLKMLESCLCLNLTNIYLSTIKMLLSWEQTGRLPARQEQSPMPLFVDCSSGNDKRLRSLSEETMAEFLRRFERFAVVMMCLRILDDKISVNRHFRDSLPAKSPDATDFINLLGSVFKEEHQHSHVLLDSIDETCLEISEKCAAIAEPLEGKKQNLDPTDNETLAVREILMQNGNPVIRLAEALCKIMPRNIHMGKYLDALTSCLMPDQSHGLAMRRKTTQTIAGKQTRIDAQSLVLSNTMLDFIVHRHLRKTSKSNINKQISFSDLLKILKDRYGLYVAESPPGMSISEKLLSLNQQILERRLRDLGLLIGVNDAESMKMLRQRYRAEGDEDAD